MNEQTVEARRAVRPAFAIAAALLAAVAWAAGAPIAPSDLDALLHAPNPPLVVDVRTPEEFRSGHIAGALNVQHDTLDRNWSATRAEIDDEVILYCGTGRRAGLAQQTLETMGWYHTRVLTGGIDAWKKAGLPLVQEDAPAPAATQ